MPLEGVSNLKLETLAVYVVPMLRFIVYFGMVLMLSWNLAKKQTVVFFTLLSDGCCLVYGGSIVLFACFSYLCCMKRLYGIVICLLLAKLTGASVLAQNYRSKQIPLPIELYEGDTIPVIHMRDVYIYQRPKFKNRRQERYYWRTVRDVKKTLPIAREVRGIIIETYEYLLTIPDEKVREEHLAAVEKGMLAQYTPRMKKLTLSQGKMLIKLVDRECDQTGYDLIRTFMGSFKAGFYQTFAALFGASLKREYDPELEDAEIEEIIYWVEQGAL